MPQAVSESRPFDLLLTGGSVFDPPVGTGVRRDLAVRDGLVVRVAESIEPDTAAVVVDVSGLLVTPGLTDLHLHAYPGATYWGIEPDWPCLAHGVTRFVDAGSAGAYTFPGLAGLLRAGRLRSRALLNLAGAGLAAPYGELLLAEHADARAAVHMALDHQDLIAGFKLRASPNTVGDNARRALSALREAADATGLPVMVHVSESPPELAVVLEYLGPGDILTHCFTPYDNCVVDARTRRIRPEVEAALARGVLLDVGHGSGSFSFAAAEAFAASGLEAPIVSTDLHRKSVLGPAFDMTTVMTKMLAAGFSAEEVLRSSTQRPARVLGEEATLSEGAVADIAVFSLDEERARLWDSRGNERAFDRRFRCRLTVLDGEVVYVDPALQLKRR